MKLKNVLLFISVISTITFAQSIEFNSKPEILLPGIVCGEKSEVKITFSKDGNLMLWGNVGRTDGKGGWDIWLSQKTDSGWSTAVPASFNSTENDFDPSFSADGRKLYFFSNRPGGFGGDDLYSVEYNSVNNTFGIPKNMGQKFNTPKDEWGPAESRDGSKFIFCSDGLIGEGQHDLYVCDKLNDGWSNPQNFSALNSADDDFDPVFLQDNKTIIFTRKISEDEAFLFISYFAADEYSKPVKLNNQINIPGTWNLGTSINDAEKNIIYYSTHIEGNSEGRLDIYNIEYELR